MFLSRGSYELAIEYTKDHHLVTICLLFPYPLLVAVYDDC